MGLTGEKISVVFVNGVIEINLCDFYLLRSYDCFVLRIKVNEY